MFKTHGRRCFEEAGDGKGAGGSGGGEPKDDGNAATEKLANELKAEQAARAKLEAELKEIRDGKLKEQNDFKTLFEQEQANHKETQTRLTKLKENVQYNEKHKAVAKALRERGLKAEAETLLDKESLDGVRIETTSEGRFLVHGADTFADSFKKKFAFAFEEKKNPNVNGGGNGGGGGDGGGGDDEPIDGAKLFKIEKEKGRNSPEYKAAFEKFKAQKLKKSS